jgi:hypothetical protein
VTLLYGKAANGTYYPVQVDDSGRIIAVYGEEGLVKPDLTAEFKSVVLNNLANRNGPGLGFFEQGSFVPRLASSNYEGTVITSGAVAYQERSGSYQIVGNRLVFSLYIATSSVAGLTGPVVLVDGIPKPVASAISVFQASITVEYVKGYNWTENYPPSIGGYVVTGANTAGFMLSTAVLNGGYPDLLLTNKLSAGENVIYAHGELWLP